VSLHVSIRPWSTAAIALVALTAFAASPFTSNAATLDGASVKVENLSEPVLCAEKDNVAVAVTSPEVRSFVIEAVHPVYLPMLKGDSFAADWTACDLSNDPVFRSNVKSPTRRTIYEEPDLWVVGWTFPTFWRPSKTVVRIGDKTFDNLHLIQIWKLRPMGGEEIAVVYPQDGYWRLRPRAPADRGATAFGSSFLIGPVTDAGRPVVEIEELAFAPKTETFSLKFKSGNAATVQMTETTEKRSALQIVFDKPVTGQPFTMVRSMYVTDTNNDAAQISVRPVSGKAWQEHPIMSFKSAEATDVWIGRTRPSRHNTSSPDLILNRFSKTTTPPKNEKTERQALEGKATDRDG